jgi:hypothetical protein
MARVGKKFKFRNLAWPGMAFLGPSIIYHFYHFSLLVQVGPAFLKLFAI